MIISSSGEKAPFLRLGRKWLAHRSLQLLLQRANPVFFRRRSLPHASSRNRPISHPPPPSMAPSSTESLLQLRHPNHYTHLRSAAHLLRCSRLSYLSYLPLLFLKQRNTTIICFATLQSDAIVLHSKFSQENCVNNFWDKTDRVTEEGNWFRCERGRWGCRV
ncbi:hypothetical protein SLA2020_020740 [Shorea laevis]